MKTLFRAAAILLGLAGPALSQTPTRVGPLEIQNRLDEIALDGGAAQLTARGNLGLGTLSTQNANAIAVTGGTVAGAAISAGTLTGAAISGGTLAGAAISGGSIANTPISGSTGSFTTLAASGNATIGGTETVGSAGNSLLTFTPGATTSIAPIISTNSTAGIQLAGGTAGVSIVGGGPLTANNGVAISRSIAPAGVALNPLNTWTANLSGSTTTANPSIYQYNGSDSLAIPSGFVNYWTMNYTFGGAGMIGNRKAMHIVSAQSSQSGNFAAGFQSPGGPFYQAVLFTQQISATEGGTSTNQNTSYGQAFAGSSTIRSFPGSTFFHGLSNWEFDMGISEPTYGKGGISIVQLSTDIAQGVLDGAVAISNAGTSANNGWHNGFVAISPNGNFPYATDGWLFNAPLAQDWATFNTMKGGINLEPVFTRAAILSRNFSVDGLGTVQVGNGYLAKTAGGVSLDASGSVGPAEGTVLSGAALVSGGTGYVGGLALHDPYGGSWSVTTAPGGVITSITNIRTPYFNSATPPANPVTLTPPLSVLGTVGGTVSVNIPWTQPNAVAISPSGGPTTIGGTLGVTGATTLAGGTMTGTYAGAHTNSGAVTFSAAGTGLAVTANATIGGSLGVTGALTGTSETLTGNLTGTTATFSGAINEGGNTVVNPAVILNGTGTGQLGIRFLVANVNRWRWLVGNAETGVGNTGSDVILQSYTDAGVGTNLLQITRSSGQFLHSSNMIVHKQLGDNSAGMTGLVGWMTVTGGGRLTNRIGGTFQSDNTGYVVNLDPPWAAGTAYNIGDVADANGQLIKATTAGTSGSTTPNCGPGFTTCSDGVVTWSFLGSRGAAYQLIGGFMSSTMASSFGGVPGATVGGVFGLNTQANVSVANANFVIGYELNYGAVFPVKERIGMQIVAGLAGLSQGIEADVGLRFGAQRSGGTGAALMKHIIDIGSRTNTILDPNGTVMRVYSEGWSEGTAGTNLISLMVGAGGLDFTMMQPTGMGDFGGGFVFRGPGSQILGSGDMQSNFMLLHQTATGASLDVSQYHVVSAAIHAGGGGTLWGAFGYYVTCQDGSVLKTTAKSGNSITTVQVIIGSYGSAPPTNPVTCSSEQYVGIADGAGNPMLPDPIQVDMTAVLANTGAPVLALGGIAAVTAATPALDNNSTLIATTGYVQGQASNILPLMDGTASAGTSPRLSRTDHVHPTDTSRYAASNPAGYQTAAQVSASITAAAYALPTATATILGGVKPDGTTITNIAGAISVTYGSAANTAAQGNDARITGALSAATAAATYQPLLGFTPAPTSNPTFTGTVNAANIIAAGGITGQSGVTAGTSASAQPVFINGPAGANRNVIWQTAGVKRFQININGTAEGGANVGSDVAMSVSDDTGSVIFTPISITRSTGLTTMTNLNATMTAGSVNNATVGATTPSTGSFTTLAASGQITWSGPIKYAGSNIVANGSVATTVTALGPPGSHTTIQEWLAVQNASGVTRFIELY